jgi:hypothetical protein
MEKNAKIVNLTPHKVVVLDDNNNVVAEFASEGVIRLSEERQLIGQINGIPLYIKRFGTTVALPPQREGVYYIVSLPVAQAFPDRSDFIVPDQVVRDNEGRIIGCRGFTRPTP